MNSSLHPRSFFLLFVFVLFSLVSSGQNGIIRKDFMRGSDQETFDKVIELPNKEYLVIGMSYSFDEDFQGNRGNADAIIVKYDASFNRVWTRNLGGEMDDVINAVLPLSDGSFILVGSTMSTTGDISNNRGQWDGWIVKLSASGATLWSKTYGGSGMDTFLRIVLASNGDFVISAFTLSTDGQLNGRPKENLGDFWMVRVSNDGTLLRSKVIGGSQEEGSLFIQKSAQGYVIVGDTNSGDGDITVNEPFYQGVWIAELNENFDITRSKILDPVHSAILSGFIRESNGDLYISTDRVYRLDQNWNEVWSHDLQLGPDLMLKGLARHPQGGVITHGVYIGDLREHARRDSMDLWEGLLERIGSDGKRKWLKFFGGAGMDYVDAALVNSSGNYILTGMAGDDVADNVGALPADNKGDAFIFEWAEPFVVKGKVFHDMNVNYKYDPGIDKDVYNVNDLLGKMEVNTSDANFTWVNSDITNNFYILLDTGSYSMKVKFLDKRDTLNYRQAPDPYTFTLSGAKRNDSVFIPLISSKLIADMALDMQKLNSGAIGTLTRYKLRWRNTGNFPFDSIRVALAIPSNVVFGSAKPAPSIVRTDSVIWIVKNVPSGAADSVEVFLQLPKPPIANIGDLITFNAVLSSYGRLENTSNNRASVTHQMLSQDLFLTSTYIQWAKVTAPTPSGTATYKLLYEYKGDIDTVLADVSMLIDRRLRFSSASKAPDRNINDSLIWEKVLLVNGKLDSIVLKYDVPARPTVDYGDILTHKAVMRRLIITQGPNLDLKLDIKDTVTLDYKDADAGPVTDKEGIEWLGSMEDADTWVPNDDVASCILPGEDIVLATRGGARTAGNGGLLLQKINKDGMVKWRKLFRDVTLSAVVSVKATADGKFGVLTSTTAGSPTVTERWNQLILFDSSGNRLWTKDLARDPRTGAGKYFGSLMGMSFLPNGNFLVSGYRNYSSVSDSTLEKGLLIEVPVDGSAISENVFAQANMHIRFNRVAINKQGEIFTSAVLDTIAGPLRSIARSYMSSLVKLDRSINGFTWIRTYPGVNTLLGFTDINTKGDTLTAVGSGSGPQRSQGFFVQHKNDGTPLIVKQFPFTSGLFLNYIAEEKAGFAILGYVNAGFGFSAVPSILRTSFQGDPLSLKVLKPVTPTPTSIQKFSHILALPQNGLLVTGSGRAVSVNGVPVPYDEKRYQVVKLNASNLVKGFVYYDLNNNGSFDAGEGPADDLLISARSGQEQQFTNPVNGLFRFYVEPGLTVLKGSVQNGFLSPKPDSIVVNKGAGMQRDSVVFRLVKLKDSADLQVQLLPLNTARPGYEVLYNLRFANMGSKASGAVRLYLVKDRRQQFLTSTVPPTQTLGDTLRWDLGILQPQKDSVIAVQFRNSPPPALNLNDSMRIVAIIEPRTGDGFPSNNTSILTQPVKGSFDPNDKTEINNGTFTPEQLANRESLVYLIRFQNTGNDTAFRVYVMDTLDQKLDLSTIEILSYSHPVRWTVKGNGVVQWIFDQINLPDSTTNEKASHGYVSFRIRPLANLKLGDVVTNRASIYFDFNAPILTNTVSTTLRTNIITSVNDPREELITIRAYPNPAVSTITVELKGQIKGGLSVQMVDMTGKVVMQKNFGQVFTQNWKQSLNIANMPVGVYTVVIRLDNEIVPFRIIKQ